MSHKSDLIENDILAYLREHEQKELLRILTCGSVDDGKSTLIGRLLHDSKMVYEDQLDAVTRDSKKSGTTGDKPDLALLVDGLKSEREQGITIDVAYRYFSTSKRKFIIADCPGHEQYTRNMATGASTCDLAIILIDARHGVQEQTRRHSYIVRLLGINHVVVAINKMDLENWSEDRFNEIKSEYTELAKKLGLKDLRFLPMSALSGDNVVEPSQNMPWHKGPTLMHIIESVHIGKDLTQKDLRFPIQWVNRPNLNFRGFSGQIASGVVRVGQEIKVMPSGRDTVIKEIHAPDGLVDEAFAPMSVTLTFEDEVDASRGDTVVPKQAKPMVANRFEAMMVWMNDDDLVPGREYIIKQGPHQTVCQVNHVGYRHNVNTFEKEDASNLRLNEIGKVEIRTIEPLVISDYDQNRALGGFVIIDRMSNLTVGAGMARVDSRTAQDHWQTPPPTGVTRPELTIPESDRVRLNKHHPATILITGLSGSGKTTTAHELSRALFQREINSFVLDGQMMRSGLNRDLGFQPSERSENLRRTMEVAKLLNDQGAICIAGFVAPEDHARQSARSLIGDGRFIHVHLSTSISVCQSRKGSNHNGQSDNRTNVPGVTEEYEVPENAELVIDNTNLTPEHVAELILAELDQRKITL